MDKRWGMRHKIVKSSLTLAVLYMSLSGAASWAADSSKAAPKSAAVHDTDLVTLGLIDGDTDGKLTTITIRLDHKPSWTTVADVQNHGSFLQLTLPGTLVPEPGKFFDGGNALIPKIAAFQLTPSDAGIRLFVSKDAGKIKQALMAEVLGNRIVLTIDGNQLTTTASAPPPVTSELVGPPAAAITADQVIARTEVSHDEPAPSDYMRSELAKAELAKSETARDGQAKSAPLATGGLDLRGKLVEVTLFAGAMLVLLLISWVARPYLKKRANAPAAWQADEPLTIKTIASLNLAARQKVSLLQIGGEKILIGITPEHVSFLTTIGASNRGPSVQASGAQAQIAEMSQIPRDFSQLLAEADAALPLPAATPKALPRQPYSASPQRDPSIDSPKARAPSRQPPRDYDRTYDQDASETPSEAPRRRATAAPSQSSAPSHPKRQPASRINVAIDEDGIKNMAPQRASARPASEEPGGQQAIDDVTRMIREKLKTLRSI